MRHRIMYFIAFIAAGAFAYIFKAKPQIEGIFEILTGCFIYFGLFISLFFACSSLMGAAAGLRRTKKYASVITKSILWSIIVTFVSVILVFLFNQIGLLGISKISANVENIKNGGDIIPSIEALLRGIGDSTSDKLKIGMSSVFALMTICTLFVAYHLKPDTKILRPAYLFHSSSTELTYKASRAICNVYVVMLFFITATFFFKNLNEQNILFLQQVKSFAIVLAIVSVALIFIVLPVLFLIFSGFKKNPIPAMWTAFVNALVATFTGRTFFAYTTINVTHRYECYMPKKTSNVSTTLLMIFSRIGSAVISYVTILFLTKDAGLSFMTNIYIAISVSCLSFVSGIFSTFEIPMIIGAISTFLDLDNKVFIHACELLPLLLLFSVFLDTYAISLGSNSVSGKIPVERKKSKA